MADPVSSLYGPGAIICWICTSLAVFLSWSFNHASQRYDRFTSDVLGCLVLPAIAAIHWFIELARFSNLRDHQQQPNETTEAAFLVCMYFMPLGLTLSLLAFAHGHKRRLAVTTVTTIPCVVIFAITVFSYGTRAPKVDTSGGGLACFLVFLVLIPACVPSKNHPFTGQKPKSKSSSRLVSLHGLAMWCARISMFIAQWAGFITLFLLQSKDTVLGDDVSPKIAVLPRTPYSISDIDQAVALSIGIITFLLSIFDTLKSYRFPIADEFEYWRTRCLQDIEQGDAKIDVSQWRKAMDYIEMKANCAATRARHYKREQYVLRQLPVIVRKCLERRNPDRRMKALGYI